MLTLIALASLSPQGLVSGSPGPSFVLNQGQFDSRVRYRASIPGGTAYLTDRGLTVDLRDETKGHSFTLSFGERGSLQPLAKTTDEKNYFIGEESTWARKVPSYDRVVRRDVAEGVNMVHYFDRGQLRYDLLVAPGANPDAVRMTVSGAKAQVAADGKTVTLDTVLGPVRLQELFAYQGDQAVACRFETRSDGTIGFKVGTYDRSKPLVIDPIVWSRYIDGANDDEIVAIVPKGTEYYSVFNVDDNPFVDSDGGYQVVNGGGRDIVVSRHYGSGVRVASTYYGGSYNERASGIAIDAQGDVRIAGVTESPNLPTKSGAYRRRRQGYSDLFAATLTSDLSDLISGTYLGGTKDENIYLASNVTQEGNLCSVDTAGNTVLAGWTESPDAYVSPTAIQKTKAGGRDIYYLKVAKDGTKINHATFFGAKADDYPSALVVSADGTTTLAGTTYSDDFRTTTGAFQTADRGSSFGSGFVSRFRANNTLAFSSYFNTDEETRLYGLDVNAAGEIALCGQSSGKLASIQGAFKIPAGRMDGFVVKLSKDAKTLLGGSFIGGSEDDAVFRVRFDSAGNLCGVGDTYSANLTTASPGAETDFSSRNSDNVAGFLVRFSPDTKIARYVSFLSGDGAVYPRTLLPLADGSWLMGGRTYASNFPVVPAGNSVRMGAVDSWLTNIAPGTVIRSVACPTVRSGGTSKIRITLNKKALNDTSVTLTDTSALTDLTTRTVVIPKNATYVETSVKVGTVSATARVTLTTSYDASTVSGILRIDP
ncbi:hypothetical protein EON81_00430 [bacterium]|nr:MAG: hypothetical protein EON81_00430 [bacterium]